jgi:hypothetical protein
MSLYGPDILTITHCESCAHTVERHALCEIARGEREICDGGIYCGCTRTQIEILTRAIENIAKVVGEKHFENGS